MDTSFPGDNLGYHNPMISAEITMNIALNKAIRFYKPHRVWIYIFVDSTAVSFKNYSRKKRKCAILCTSSFFGANLWKLQEWHILDAASKRVSQRNQLIIN